MVTLGDDGGTYQLRAKTLDWYDWQAPTCNFSSTATGDTSEGNLHTGSAFTAELQFDTVVLDSRFVPGDENSSTDCDIIF